MKMFDFVDPYILVTLFCVWIITSYVFVAGVAYLLGRVSSPARAHGMATLRPPQRLAVSDLPSSEPAIFTTRYGKYWHRTRDRAFLEVSTQVLVRQPCVACVRRSAVDGVAETPPRKPVIPHKKMRPFWGTDSIRTRIWLRLKFGYGPLVQSLRVRWRHW